jgi:HUS1 checkpoint protein
MKYGIKLFDPLNIAHFTHVIATVSKLCARASNNKTCVLKLTDDSLYFILTEFASNNAGNGGTGRTAFWMTLDSKCLFDVSVLEGRTADENFIFVELQPESLLRALKSATNVKTLRLKLTKRQTPCFTVELDMHSISSKSNSRLITHDIPVNVINTVKLNMAEFQEPSIENATLSIQMPPLKLLKHMIDRMNHLSEFVCLEATNRGTLTLRIETDQVSVCSYFQNLPNMPLFGAGAGDKNNRETADRECSVRLGLKKLSDFVNALQFQPSKIICNFVNQKYAHFFVVHDEDLVLQYLISSVLI